MATPAPNLSCPFCQSVNVIANGNWNAAGPNDVNSDVHVYLVDYKCDECHRQFWIDADEEV